MKRILAGLLLVGAASFAVPAEAHPICTPLQYTGMPICVHTD